MSPVISTADLTKRFGKKTAVSNLTLEVSAGEVFGLLGPNGAGKSTTIRLLLGLARPTSGSVSILGSHDVKGLLRKERLVGSLLENPSFYPTASAQENLRFLALLAGDGAAFDRIEPLLDRVGLFHRRRDPVRKFSHGMRQRLAFAAALLQDPLLIVLDEPYTGLDPTGIREFSAHIRSLRDAGKTVFLSSHLLTEVQRLCDRVGFLNQGRLVDQFDSGAPARMRTRVRLASEHLEQALQILSPLGVVSRDPPYLVVEGASSTAVNKALAGQGIVAAEVYSDDRTLEELFQRLSEP